MANKRNGRSGDGVEPARKRCAARALSAAAAVLLFATAMPGVAQEPASPQQRSTQPGTTAEQRAAQGSTAKQAGALPEEEEQFCQAAAQDAKYLKRCDEARHDLESRLSHFAADLEMGRMEFARKDYSDALRDLNKIAFGPHRDEALALMEKIRLASGEITAEQISESVLEAGRAAYAKGEFDKAEDLLGRVRTSATQDAANQMLTNLRLYRQSMKEAGELAGSGDHRSAAQKYQFAAVIRSDGPGLPREHQSEEEARAQAVAANPPPAAAPPPPEPVQASAAPPAKARAGKDARGTPPPPVKKRVAAPGESSGETGLAGGSEAGSGTLEPELAQAIGEVYASHFLSGENGLRRYLRSGGKKHEGAAHFFLGDALLTQAMLADPRDRQTAEALRQEARREFVAARQLHYAPISAVVSPKVMTQWARVEGTR